MITKTARFKRLRQMPCCCGCGRSAPSDVAHSNQSKHGKGMGLKANDEHTIPLNRVCHGRYDTFSMGMNKEQSDKWFDEKVKYTNEVLYGKDKRPVF